MICSAHLSSNLTWAVAYSNIVQHKILAGENFDESPILMRKILTNASVQ